MYVAMQSLNILTPGQRPQCRQRVTLVASMYGELKRNFEFCVQPINVTKNLSDIKKLHLRLHKYHYQLKCCDPPLLFTIYYLIRLVVSPPIRTYCLRTLSRQVLLYVIPTQAVRQDDRQVGKQNGSKFNKRRRNIFTLVLFLMPFTLFKIAEMFFFFWYNKFSCDISSLFEKLNCFKQSWKIPT